jgi:hypothetical protein
MRPQDHAVKDVPRATADQKWRPVAWNGIGFEVPPDWEIIRIGHRYLLLGAPDRPVLEVKWATVNGRFSLRSQLKRLAASQGRSLRQSMRPEKLPAEWAAVLGRYDGLGFTWQGAAVGGHGVILYCPEGRKAILVQFFGVPGQRRFAHARRILASLEDNGDGRVNRLRVFDIRAEVPGGFYLKRFRFEAGVYELNFTNRQLQLTLHRWSPATALLGNGDLEAFEQKRCGLSANQRARVIKPTPLALEVAVEPPRAIFLRWWRRGQPPYRRLRLWHEVDKNRLLGIGLASRRPIDQRTLERLCAGYATV